MKVISLNSEYGMIKAVIRGTKTQARVMCPKCMMDEYKSLTEEYKSMSLRDFMVLRNPFVKGEEIAVAQTYKELMETEYLPKEVEDAIITLVQSGDEGVTDRNKVRGVLMPHRIEVTNVRVGSLYDISDADCIRNGVEVFEAWDVQGYGFEGDGRSYKFNTPREAYCALIDKVFKDYDKSEDTPVYVLDFKLVG